MNLPAPVDLQIDRFWSKKNHVLLYKDGIDRSVSLVTSVRSDLPIKFMIVPFHFYMQVSLH
jgi:hypothetical protein